MYIVRNYTVRTFSPFSIYYERARTYDIMEPVRRVTSEEDLRLFRESQTYHDLVNFVEELNSSVVGKELGITPPVSTIVEKLVALVRIAAELVMHHPAAESSSRFGKPEFRDFHNDFMERVTGLLLDAGIPRSYVPELGTYLSESWGSVKRLDYGSGHELNFLCFLLCIRKLGLIKKGDYRNLVLGVFAEYLHTMRLIQRTYWLEPAGSHGVWGLDDYHFLPFLFGSGQLISHPYLRPISIHDRDLVDMFAEKYLYFECIQFIDSIKKASLRWHSPMLDDISGVKKWAKVNEGMIKMYKAEVLGKLPIIQHFLFGSLLPAADGMTAAADVGEEVHIHCWADCCGIRVPSAVAANEASQKQPGHTVRKAKGIAVD